MKMPVLYTVIMTKTYRKGAVLISFISTVVIDTLFTVMHNDTPSTTLLVVIPRQGVADQRSSAIRCDFNSARESDGCRLAPNAQRR